MVRSNAWVLRAMALCVAAAVTLTACSGSSPSASAAGASAGASAAPSGGPHVGGTITILDRLGEIDQVDPQRAYTGEDLAFFSGTIYRSLTAYVFSADDVKASGLVPDLATDLGKSSTDAKTWTYTLRDGITFEDGSAITCADIKYGASRTFATDIITGGPSYAIQYLDIPTVTGFDKDADGKSEAASSSAYFGPYVRDPFIFSDAALTKPLVSDTAAFDKAIECSADGKTITFHLNQPVPDFAYTLTLGWSPVPKAADLGIQYGAPGHPPVSSGPYKVESYTTGPGGKMVLVRNDKWSQASDTYRHPYPDKWEIDFNLDPKVIDQRLLTPSGADVTAVMNGNVQPENLAKVFKDQKTPKPEFEGRAVSAYDIYSLYIWINQETVKNVKIREAMAVALNRDALRKNAGGLFVGDFADGTVKPNIGPDYAPTGMWTDMFGKAIPDSGDPEFAKQLIADSGEAAPTLTYDYNAKGGPVSDRAAGIVKASLELAGFKIKLNPIPAHYYSVVYSTPDDFGTGGWGADWPNAKTVVFDLFVPKGGWDLSRANDPDFNTKSDAASAETDRTKQETMWQALNKQSMQNVWAIPTFFELQQRLTGGKIGNAYFWGPYGSWAYGDMYVMP